MKGKKQSIYEKYKESVQHCHGLPLPQNLDGEHFCESFGCWDIVELLTEIENLKNISAIEPIRDQIGKLPKIDSAQQALREILKITRDKRTHPLYEDAINWEKLKKRAIAILAKRGLKSKGE